MNDVIRDLIHRGVSSEKIRDAALRSGMRPLRQAALDKVFDGVTTIDEAVRETTIEA
jgi:type II secretory ATPase GspE/PulE/Tfp pilus assembly ATPase PilB-like protein